jgi:hypothetical protein
MLDRDQVIWAAGFFDGEGHVGCDRNRKQYILKANVSQGDTEVLYRFLEAVKLGVVYGPYGKVTERRPNQYYRWQLVGVDNVELLFDILSPYLSSIKTCQFRESIDKFYDYRSTLRSYLPPSR